MRRMYSKEQLQKLIDEVSRLIAIEELDKVVPVPSVATAGYIMQVNEAGTGYELKPLSDLDLITMEGIKDADGHNRFIDGDITPSEEIPAADVKYAKWTLSGSHLMIVFAFLSSEDKSIAGKNICSLQIPQWIYNKIYSMNTGTDHVSVIDSVKGYIPDNLTPSTNSIRPYIYKDTNNQLRINGAGNSIIETGFYYRFVFDLVIA